MNPNKIFGVQKRPDLLSAIVRARTVDRSAVVRYLNKFIWTCKDIAGHQRQTADTGLKSPLHFQPLWKILSSMGVVLPKASMQDVIESLHWVRTKKAVVQAIATEPGRESLRALEDVFKNLGEESQNCREHKTHTARKIVFRQQG